ncbi:MAG TPA: hypothetical protein VD769_00290 [Gaiellaceae bacterium]|nr:hypothetical protein [Gaiellaceae bacterium]
MSSVALFALGIAVTLLVGASMSLLVWGAILDGRYEDEQRAAVGDDRRPAGGDERLLAAESARGKP